ncbi:hypothetical protein BDC45DRAFT_556084 [Circinella umbellata]|nr:hypothetical protein BDC45DRAFT_556084 [Circinella umbellata]
MSSEQLPATIPDHTSVPTISDTVSDIDTTTHTALLLNEHVQRRDQLLTGIRTITDTLPFIPPIQRAQLEPVIFSQQQEALAVDQHIAELDQQLQIDRQAMAYEFNTAYNQHPEHFRSLLADTE